MNSFLKMCACAFRLSGLLAVMLSLVGCKTMDPASDGSAGPDGTSLNGNLASAGTNGASSPRSSSDLLRRGDPITIIFSGVQDPPNRHEERIKDDGKITLPLIGSVEAIGKTMGELQDEIRGLYVDKYYKRLNVIVTSEARVFMVSGEVRKPDRHQYLGEMTLLKAIAAAGDFSDFANRKKVQITRSNGQKIVVNCTQALRDQKLDVRIYPDDQIFVPRRLW